MTEPTTQLLFSPAQVAYIQARIKIASAAMKERCVKVADNMAYVETCADDTANGTANAAPYRKVATAIRALKDEP